MPEEKEFIIFLKMKTLLMQFLLLRILRLWEL